MKRKFKRHRARRARLAREAALRAKANKLRVRLPVKERHLARIKHERRMRADASSGRRFPYSWSFNW